MPVFDKTRPFMASASRGVYTIIGIPLDLTTSYRPGTRFAPSAIREASYCLEEYDILYGGDLRERSFSDKGDIQLSGSLQQALEEIKEAIREIINEQSLPISIGGEHLVTFPVLSVLKEVFSDLYVIVLDAHADMRKEYNGLPLSHATVFRRVSEIIPYEKIFQFGIRSGSKEEADYYRTTGIYHSYEFPDDGFFKRLNGKRVYLSIDIDVLDPAFAPGTGTPEPYGWRPGDVLDFIKKLKGIRLAGADIVEVSPPYDPSGITSLMAARIIREIILFLT
jgi:agmatinase